MLHITIVKLTGVFCILFILSACSGGDTNIITPKDPIPNEAAYDTPDNLASLQTDEYIESNILGNIKAAYAYGNIQPLVDDDDSGMVTQGGEGQIISIVSTDRFATGHQEFNELDTDGSTIIQGAAFDSIYVASHTADGTLYIDNTGSGGTNDILDNAKGNCTGHRHCRATKYAALIAGRKDDTGMHGVAYKAKLRAMFIDNADNTTQLTNTLQNGVGANIIAMNHVWNDETISTCSSEGIVYTRPKGKNILACDGTLSDSDPLESDELDAWKAAISNDNNSIMVFDAGGNGWNSETGQATIEGTTYKRNAISVTGSIKNTNIPNFHAAYPVFDENDGLEATKWLVVTALDENNKILPEANGCGVAMHFCLAAPGQNISTTDKDFTGPTGYVTATDTKFASNSVAGALAVLKGAFPNATSEQLTQLVLETATYIPLDGRDNNTGNLLKFRARALFFTEDILYRTTILRADGTKRYINPVYGYGLLNLAAASTPSVASSYVTASNNQSIGALWQDTKLTLSSHFGGNFESVKFGIGDAYGRHFITNAPQTNYAPVTIGLDDYIGNLLGENVQSQKLGGQVQANYSNSEQSWMDLHYTSGNATTKIAFQDSYKISPLNAVGTTSILRANNIRPASTNIGMMDVDYALNGNLSLSSYLARGEYDTGYKFDELATDFDVNYKASHLNIAIGNIREHGQFLGTNTSGAYALNAPSISRFTDVTYGHDLGAKFNIYANYINYETDVDMLHDQFASIDGLQADQYQIGFTGKDLISKDDSLNVALITKLGVTDGALNQNTVLGYTADGAFNNASQSYDLAVSDRHQQFEITYQGKLYQNADKISNFRDNRFFTTIRVDQNLNHVQGASQVEIVSGINARF